MSASDEIPKRMRPVIILPKGEMSAEDMARLNANDFCVVEAEHPENVRFMEPPPEGYTGQERAAIRLCRTILDQGRHANWSGADLIQRLVHYLVAGTPLGPPPAPPKVKKS